MLQDEVFIVLCRRYHVRHNKLKMIITMVINGNPSEICQHRWGINACRPCSHVVEGEKKGRERERERGMRERERERERESIYV